MAKASILEAEHIERAEHFARGLALSSSFEFFVAVAHHTELIEPFARRMAGATVSTDGSPLRVRWLRWAGADAAVEAIEELRAEQGGPRQLIIFDLADAREADLDGLTRFAGALNLRRDGLPRALTGGMLIAIPEWLEPRFAATAPDLWSVVSSAKLVRGAESFPASVLDDWWTECDARFEELRATLSDDIYRHGTYTFAYAFEPGAVDGSTRKMLEAMRRVPQYTGWALWQVPAGELRPKPRDGNAECWLFDEPRRGRPDRSDFWRSSGQGRLYLRRPYQEDFHLEEPAQYFSRSLPLWRIGEALLHTRSMAEALGLRSTTRLRFHARWTGLAKRKLTAWPEKGLFAMVPELHTREDDIESSLLFEVSAIDTQLERLVETLTSELYTGFEFYEVPTEFISQELEKLRRRLSG